MRRVAVLGLLVLFALVGGAALGLSAVTSENEPANATIAEFEPRVAVGNESGDALSGSGEVVTCNEQGPMPGNAGLTGDMVVDRPLDDDGPNEATFGFVVTVGDGLIRDTHNVTLKPGVSHRFVAFEITDQPDELSGGDEITVTARVVTEDNVTVATASRTVTVIERDVPCAEERTN